MARFDVHSLRRALSQYSQGSPKQRTRRSRHRVRPKLDQMETRELLSTLTVTNANDSGPGSLRATVGLANTGDVVQFSKSLDFAEITLTSGEIPINEGITIKGPAPQEGIVVSGNGASRIFNVDDPGGSVTIVNLNLFDGFSDLGGAILNQAGKLTLNTVNFEDNTALGSSPGGFGQGGAVANVGSTATLVVGANSAFEDNFATGMRAT